jgi:hypothetical protein
VPRVTRAAMMRCLAAAATSAQPVQDAAWNAVALRHLQSIVASLHFYSSPALTQRISTGTAYMRACQLLLLLCVYWWIGGGLSTVLWMLCKDKCVCLESTFSG